MAPCTLVVMLFFSLCCNALQNEKCNFSVIIKQTAEKFACFRMMEGHAPICTSDQSTSSCQIDYSQGSMCLKWQTAIELTCVNDSLKTLTEEKKCARNQQSISCSGEYQSGDSVSTLSMSKPLTTACAVLSFFHWMALNPFF